MLNGTVSDARLSLVARSHSPARFLIACVREGRPIAFALHGSALRLYVEHEVDAIDGKAHTASYRYVLQAEQAHESWLVRRENLRERPPAYPHALGHVHVQADFLAGPRAALASKPLSRLHLPTARVAFELVLRHVIAEWAVRPKSDDWEAIPDAPLTGFEERGAAP